MREVLLIGVGNPYRKDDRLGWEIVERIAPRPGLTKSNHSGEGTGLMELWDRHSDRMVILVDAKESGSGAGTFQYWNSVQNLPAGMKFRCSSHQFGVLEALALAKELGTLPKDISLLGVEGTDFSFGTEFSSDVERAIPEAVGFLEREVEKCMK